MRRLRRRQDATPADHWLLLLLLCCRCDRSRDIRCGGITNRHGCWWWRRRSHWRRWRWLLFCNCCSFLRVLGRLLLISALFNFPSLLRGRWSSLSLVAEHNVSAGVFPPPLHQTNTVVAHAPLSRRPPQHAALQELHQQAQLSRAESPAWPPPRLAGCYTVLVSVAGPA